VHDQRAFRVSLTLSAADARGGAAVPQCPIVYAGWVEEINQEGKNRTGTRTSDHELIPDSKPDRG
jgi:hypothetical protein